MPTRASYVSSKLDHHKLRDLWGRLRGSGIGGELSMRSFVRFIMVFSFVVFKVADFILLGCFCTIDTLSDNFFTTGFANLVVLHGAFR
jgi:hypothetical protein